MSRIINFDCETNEQAIAALLVYAIYRSRNQDKFKVSTEMWGQIERFVKSSAKRADNLNQFIETLRPKMHCENMNAKHLDLVGSVVGKKSPIILDSGVMATFENDRDFLSAAINGVDHRDVLDLLYKETTYIVMLVRERIEIEKNVGA